MPNNCTIIRMLPKDNIYGNVITHGFAVFKHWHSEMEFIYVKSGNLEIEIDDTVYEVKQGHLMIVASGVLHAYMEAAPTSEIWAVRILLKDILSCSGMKEIMGDLYSSTTIIRTSAIMVRIMQELIYADFGAMNDCYTIIKASELTVEILKDKSCIKNYIDGKVVENSENIAKMQQYVENLLHKEITLTMVAEYMGFSVSYCSKYIKKKTNLNFLDYVNSIRMREAETLLRTTDLGITQISYSTGFNSIQSFNRIFKKLRGITPTEYRKSLRNKNQTRLDKN